MKVSEYIDYLIQGEVGRLAVSDVGDMSANPSTTPNAVQVANQQKMIGYVNLANLAIHKRFALLKKNFEMDNPVDGEEFTLPSDFLAPIGAYYTSDKVAVAVRDPQFRVISGVDTAVSILLPEPFLAVIKGTDSEARAQIILEYCAAPRDATTTYYNLGISKVYTEALLHYAAYKAFSAINSDIKEENNTHYLRYDAACKEIVRSGMWGNNETEINRKLEDRGFV